MSESHPGLTRARQLCTQMSNQVLLEEYSKGGDAVLPEAWEALQAEVKHRGLRLKPWKDQSRVVLTTAPALDGYRVTETINIISSQSALGLGLVTDLLTSVRDVVGGQSNSLREALQDGHRHCLFQLSKEAHELDADAVIAIDVKYSQFSGQNKSMLLVVATGTAVRVEPIR